MVQIFVINFEVIHRGPRSYENVGEAMLQISHLILELTQPSVYLARIIYYAVSFMYNSSWIKHVPNWYRTGRFSSIVKCENKIYKRNKNKN